MGAAEPSAPRSPTTSIAEAPEFVQRRVANLGMVLACIGGAFVVMRFVAIMAVAMPERLLSTSMIVHYGGVAVSLGMWLVCRRGAHSRSVTYGIELGGLFVVCCLYAVMAVGIPQAFRPEMTIVLGFGVFLLAHAVHVPSSWQWTAVLGAAFAVPLFFAAWTILNPMDPRIVAASASAAGSVQTTPESIIGIGMASVITWWVVIASTAAAASSVIYGLRRDVRDAQQLGQYHLESKLGEGGMGAVYRARHAMLRREAAIKLVKPDASGNDGTHSSKAKQRFEREAHVTANLKSPHTIQLYDFGVSDDGAFYYVMELLDGINLEDVVRQFGPLPCERVIYLLCQICESLEEAHAAGLVHRDIKPANIFLCRHGIRYDFIKVLDFGLVALGPERENQDMKLTADGVVGGTPAYMAPEMVAEGYDVDHRADIYSLGCVAYWLLTGRTLFEGRTAMATVLAHVEEPPVPPSRVTEVAVPTELEQLVMQCLAKEPADRPESAAELARLLSTIEVTEPWTQQRAKRWWESCNPKAIEEPITGSDKITTKLTRALSG